MTFLMAGVSSSAAFTRSGASEVKPPTKRNVKTTVRVVEWIHFIGNLLALKCAMLAQMSGLRIIQYADSSVSNPFDSSVGRRQMRIGFGSMNLNLTPTTVSLITAAASEKA